MYFISCNGAFVFCLNEKQQTKNVSRHIAICRPTDTFKVLGPDHRPAAQRIDAGLSNDDKNANRVEKGHLFNAEVENTK